MGSFCELFARGVVLCVGELPREQGRRGVQDRRCNLRWRFIHGGDGDGDRDGSWGGGVRLGAALKAAANASSVATLVACLWQRLAQPRAARRLVSPWWFSLVWFGLVFVGF